MFVYMLRLFFFASNKNTGQYNTIQRSNYVCVMSTDVILQIVLSNIVFVNDVYVCYLSCLVLSLSLLFLHMPFQVYMCLLLLFKPYSTMCFLATNGSNV